MAVAAVSPAKAGIRFTPSPSAAGLTPELLPQGITFRQAETTLVCRKIYCQDLDLEQIPQEVRDAFYKDEPVHRMYIGEVVEIIKG